MEDVVPAAGGDEVAAHADAEVIGTVDGSFRRENELRRVRSSGKLAAEGERLDTAALEIISIF